MNPNFSLQFFIPEIYMLALVVALFFQSISKNFRERTDWVPYASFAGVFLALITFGQNGSFLYSTFKVDGLSQFFKFAVFLGLAVCSANASRNNTLEEKVHRADYFMFMALSCFGLVLLSSAVEMFTIFIALELSAFSLYVLIPLRRNEPRAAEAGIKYILFGAAATALGLYGISYILAVKHTTFLHALSQMSWSFENEPLAVIGFSLFLIAFLYKLALFPFHFWCPDVFQGTSNETAAFAATLPKLGAVAVLIRVISFMPAEELKTILSILAALSMTIANLAALNQKDVKRLLGYSSVSHAGYIMLGLIAAGAYGLASAAFYSLVYLLMNLAVFWVITRLAGRGQNIYLNDLNGLHKTAPLLALVLAIGAFSLVGLPPTGGFTGKLFLMTAAWKTGHHWVVIIAALNTGLAVYYYLNLVRHAYTVPATGRQDFSPSWPAAGIGLLMAAGIVYLGIAPGNILDWLLRAGQMLKF
ncbi:MAG: NADH-quinone oxidoreductase subunit N [Desulfonatronovibrionaceae bacterium]